MSQNLAAFYFATITILSRGGKDCWTEFERLSFNGSSSVVLCRPHTGRMHQIRLHLQFIGQLRQNQMYKNKGSLAG